MLNNFSIGAKLTAFTAALLVLVAGIGAKAFLDAQSNQKRFEAYKSLAVEQSLIGDINEDFLQARLAAMKFQRLGDLSLADEVYSNLAEITDLGIDANEAAVNATFAAEVAKLKEEAATYGAAFEDAVAVRGDQAAVAAIYAERLDEIGPRVSAQVDNAQNTLQARQAELGDQALSEIATTKRLIVLVGIAGVIAGIGLAFFMTRMISRPIKQITGVLRALAKGETTIEVPARDRSDEVGVMAGAAETLRQGLEEKAMLEAEQAKFNDRAAMEQARKREMAELADRFENEISSVMTALTNRAEKLREAAGGMTTAAENNERRATDIASASGQAATSVQTVSAATEQLSASVSEISEQVARASSVSQEAARSAENTNTRISGLAQAADRIGEIVTLIQDIAAQTNLLALNATIESARAGEAGKSFAVVAGEVKTLANQTQKATEQIAEQIQAVQSETKQAVDAIRDISAIVQQVSEISQSVASAAEEQHAATSEIAGSAQQAAEGTANVSGTVGELNETAKQAQKTSADVLDASEELASKSQEVLSNMTAFLEKIRAA